MSGTVALADLRARIRALELGEASVAAPVATLGAAAIDDVLPGGGLARGALHEIEVAKGRRVKTTRIQGRYHLSLPCLVEGNSGVPIVASLFKGDST